ncbi:hypothetical protein GBAR_LOCUS15899 [Geodia barretti]|uniref:Sushi domain-containing protein n=1 Tax=Geodia barretti TaxID=519541 RepID=A0AA35SDD2_GEOBA|nr:hypothetical protein GBAR_LOCUS15899 [Geodia barretti]
MTPDPHHWWTVEEGVETGHVFVLHQAKSSDRGSYTAEVEVKHPNGNTISVLTKTFHVTSPKCDKPVPSIENGHVSTLESNESDINGAQANYSCNDGCELEGSKSLRCQIVVTNHLATSQWVNDTEQNEMPSCSCTPPGITPTHTFTVSNKIPQIKSTSTSTFLNAVPGQVSEGETTPLLVVAVGATTGLLLAFILVTALIVVSVVIWLRRRREIKSPPEEEAYYQGADDNDSPENQSVSHISHSDYDDNLSNHEDFIEIPASFKNSDPFPI